MHPSSRWLTAGVLISLSLAGFVLGTLIQEFYRGTRARHNMYQESYPYALVRLIGRNRRRYGGYIVHLGILTYFVAFAGYAFKIDKEATLKPGESVSVRSPYGHEYTLTHLGVSQNESLNRIASTAAGT